MIALGNEGLIHSCAVVDYRWVRKKSKNDTQNTDRQTGKGAYIKFRWQRCTNMGVMEKEEI